MVREGTGAATSVHKRFPTMRHAPFGQPPPSDSSESESSEEAESAEEDESEEELLIKTQLLYHTQRPWGWSDMFAALSSATLWVVSSVAFAVANANLFRTTRFLSPCALTSCYMATVWLFSRALLVLMRHPPLLFIRCALSPCCGIGGELTKSRLCICAAGNPTYLR